MVRETEPPHADPSRYTGRKLYYISAEFLIGKLLSNNLINLGLYDDSPRRAGRPRGKKLSDIEEVEPEPCSWQRRAGPSGGLLPGLPGHAEPAGRRCRPAVSLRPVPPVSVQDGVQKELPDPWLTAHCWAEKTDITVYPCRAGREDLQRPAVQAGGDGLRGPHEHAEPVRSRHRG